MVLPVIGTTPDSQLANQSVSATTSATGGAQWVGPSGIQGSTVTCAVTIPNAPSSAVFVATLGTIGGQGVIVDTWGGSPPLGTSRFW